MARSRTPHPAFWLPFGLLVAVGAVLGLRLGVQATGLDEGDVIRDIARAHVEHTPGAEITDCAAMPGLASSEVWLRITCQMPGGQGAARIYEVNRQGGLLTPSANTGAPRT